MHVQSFMVLALAILLSLVRCTAVTQTVSTRASPAHALHFVTLLGSDQQHNVTIELGMVNRATRTMEAQEDGPAVWELVDADGHLRASGRLEHLPRLAPDEASFPLRWQGTLEPGHYTLTWGCSKIDLQQTGFQVVERQGRRSLLLDLP
jgi:hypothetical protein